MHKFKQSLPLDDDYFSIIIIIILLDNTYFQCGLILNTYMGCFGQSKSNLK